MLNDDQPFASNDKGASAARPPLVPGHRLLRQIARGSYGEIWLARTELGAFRAVKIVRRANFSDARPYEREFAGIQRYEPVSREHEGLVDVLQVGSDEANGFFYYIMELADDAGGAPLTPSLSPSDGERVSEGRVRGLPPAHSPTFSPAGYAPLTLAHAILTRTRLPVSEVVELGLSLARALEFLHSRRLVHRDIKPSNIIFVGGQPKLADVGLIADLGGLLTFVGTEGYIPPEGPGSAQADIYSLGKVLYEAATGKDRQEFPDLPTNLNVLPGVPPAEPITRLGDGTAGGTHGSTFSRSQSSCAIPEFGELRNRLGETQDDLALLELNEVLLKACESNPRARYSSAAAMAADLERIKAGQSLRDRRVRRQRIRTIAVGSSLLAGIALLAAGSAALVQHERSKPRELFRDDFDGRQLDTNQWMWGESSYGVPDAGTSTFKLEPSGGELVMQARAAHTDGDSVSQGIWLELKREFKSTTPCRVEIELEGTAERGSFSIAIADAWSRPRREDSDSRNLFEVSAQHQVEPAIQPAAKLRIELMPTCEAAVIIPDTRYPQQFEVVDLRKMRSWRLRLHAFAGTSRNRKEAAVDFRIKQVSVATNPDGDRVVGIVVNEISGRPLSDAVIKDRAGEILAKTRSNGAFIVPRSKGAQFFSVELDGYVATSEQPIEVTERRNLAIVRLRKEQLGFGDVEAAFSYGELNVKSLGFRHETPAVLVRKLVGSSEICQLFSLNVEKQQTLDVPFLATGRSYSDAEEITEFVECGKRFIGLRHWKTTIFDLDAEPTRKLTDFDGLVEGKRRLDWPKGAAYDGRLLWFIERDVDNGRFWLHGFDLESGEITKGIESKDRGISGLAWDGGQFWISSEKGEVYQVDRDAALNIGTVEGGINGSPIHGHYERLAFGAGYLWGLDQKMRLICKIKICD